MCEYDIPFTFLAYGGVSSKDDANENAPLYQDGSRSKCRVSACACTQDPRLLHDKARHTFEYSTAESDCMLRSCSDRRIYLFIPLLP